MLTASPALNEPLPKIVNKNVSINSFTDEQICSTFRFRNQIQMHRLCDSFQFHNRSFILSGHGHRYSGKVVLLAGLYHLLNVCRHVEKLLNRTTVTLLVIGRVSTIQGLKMRQTDVEGNDVFTIY